MNISEHFARLVAQLPPHKQIRCASGDAPFSVDSGDSTRRDVEDNRNR